MWQWELPWYSHCLEFGFFIFCLLLEHRLVTLSKFYECVCSASVQILLWTLSSFQVPFIAFWNIFGKFLLIYLELLYNLPISHNCAIKTSVRWHKEVVYTPQMCFATFAENLLKLEQRNTLWMHSRRCTKPIKRNLAYLWEIKTSPGHLTSLASIAQRPLKVGIEKNVELWSLLHQEFGGSQQTNQVTAISAWWTLPNAGVVRMRPT